MADKTILVVEDNTIQREGLTVILRQLGYAVLSAKDGSDAMNRLSSGPAPDLILLDMLVSDLGRDGWWFLEQRKSILALASVPVIIATAIPVASHEWATSLGAAGLIRKPFEVEPLIAEIQRCLQHG